MARAMRTPMPLAASLLLAGLPAQRPDDPPTLDPYTRGDAAAMARAGIQALQRFPWSDDHTTVGIQSLMGNEPFRFVETAHFKLACSLPAASVPGDADGRRRVRAELEALRQVLPAVDPASRTLDPWLRTHLYARRLESAYAEFAQRFDATDAALAAHTPRRADAPDYAGEGPFLGLRGKFLVVLARSGASLGTYARNFLDLPPPRVSTRHHLARAGSLLLLSGEQLADENHRDDASLHATVAYHAGHMFVDAYRGYWHDCPAWFEEGVAHWFRRRAAPDRMAFTERPAHLPRDPAAGDWAANVRARLASGNTVAAADLFLLRSDKLHFDDHLAAWSRVDFLFTAHGEALPLFARMLKGPDPDAVPPVPAASLIHDRQENAIRAVFGWAPADFDAQWSAWALRTYPKT
jgi:hypothetical protein